MKRGNEGITLITLVITIAVLIILASVGIYSGVEVIRQAKLNQFTAEMKIMQTEVNELYDRNTRGETEILNYGKDLKDVDEQADSVFTSDASGITDKTGYRYYDQATIQSLGIDGVDGEFFVNVQKRSVISYDGLDYEGTTYYTIEQLPSGLYNVEYKNKNTDKPTFEISIEKMNDNKWRITVLNIQYNGYIEKWTVKYKEEGEGYWSTSEDLSFVVTKSGKYDIYLQNGDVVSETENRYVGVSFANVTAQMVSTTRGDSNNQIVERIIQVSNEVTLNYPECRWVCNTESEEIGTDESKYTGGAFSSQEEEIAITTTGEADYYLHILTVDTNGNRMETIVGPIAI